MVPTARNGHIRTVVLEKEGLLKKLTTESRYIRSLSRPLFIDCRSDTVHFNTEGGWAHLGAALPLVCAALLFGPRCLARHLHRLARRPRRLHLHPRRLPLRPLHFLATVCYLRLRLVPLVPHRASRRPRRVHPPRPWPSS